MEIQNFRGWIILVKIMKLASSFARVRLQLASAMLNLRAM